MVAVAIGTGALLWHVKPCSFGRVIGVAVLPCSYFGEEVSTDQGPGVAREMNYRLSHLTELRVPPWGWSVPRQEGMRIRHDWLAYSAPTGWSSAACAGSTAG
jgi:hypothetical protein